MNFCYFHDSITILLSEVSKMMKVLFAATIVIAEGGGNGSDEQSRELKVRHMDHQVLLKRMHIPTTNEHPKFVIAPWCIVRQNVPFFPHLLSRPSTFFERRLLGNSKA